MGDGNDDQSFLAKLLDVIKSLPPLITALVSLATVISAALLFLHPTAPAAPEISTFLIDPDNITAGDNAILSWAVLNADSIYINHGVGIVKNNPGSCSITPEPSFTSYTIKATNKENISTNKTFPISVQLKNLSLYYSPYKEMIVHEKYPFDVSVAMNDSIEAARNQIRVEVNASHNKSVIIFNPTDIGTKNTSINIEGSRLTGAYLTLTGEDKEAFNITLNTPVDTSILKNSSGHNYVVWRWVVVPQMIGLHTLTITAGLNFQNGKYEQLFSDTYIDVNVNPAVPAAAPAKAENVTTAAAAATKAAANATKEAAAASQNATAPAAKTPGFEGLFAIVGMIAIAHLILSRKQ